MVGALGATCVRRARLILGGLTLALCGSVPTVSRPYRRGPPCAVWRRDFRCFMVSQYVRCFRADTEGELMNWDGGACDLCNTGVAAFPSPGRDYSFIWLCDVHAPFLVQIAALARVATGLPRV